MKRLLRLALFFSPMGILIAAPGAGLSLRGYSIEGPEAWMYLSDERGGQRWVRVGEWFGDYRVVGWQSKNQTVTLVRQGERLDLPCEHHGLRGANSPSRLADQELVAREIEQLTASAYQFFLEQSRREVRGSDLVGEEKPLRYLESELRDFCEDFKFMLGREGVEIRLAGELVFAASPAAPLLIQAGPTQSLPRISEHLQLPLKQLQRLNPGLDLAPFTEPKRVRLH